MLIHKLLTELIKFILNECILISPLQYSDNSVEWFLNDDFFILLHALIGLNKFGHKLQHIILLLSDLLYEFLMKQIPFLNNRYKIVGTMKVFYPLILCVYY
jgi:hypothetical protein